MPSQKVGIAWPDQGHHRAHVVERVLRKSRTRSRPGIASSRATPSATAVSSRGRHPLEDQTQSRFVVTERVPEVPLEHPRRNASTEPAGGRRTPWRAEARDLLGRDVRREHEEASGPGEVEDDEDDDRDPRSTIRAWASRRDVDAHGGAGARGPDDTRIRAGRARRARPPAKARRARPPRPQGRGRAPEARSIGTSRRPSPAASPSPHATARTVPAARGPASRPPARGGRRARRSPRRWRRARGPG